MTGFILYSTVFSCGFSFVFSVNKERGKAVGIGSGLLQLHKLLREVLEERELWSDSLVAELPKHWEKHGDLLLFPPLTLASDNWKSAGR